MGTRHPHPDRLMFGIFGLLLTGYGLLTRARSVTSARSATTSTWNGGVVLLVFGAVMLFFGQRGRRK